jgi:hypothetical protein
MFVCGVAGCWNDFHQQEEIDDFLVNMEEVSWKRTHSASTGKKTTCLLAVTPHARRTLDLFYVRTSACSHGTFRWCLYFNAWITNSLITRMKSLRTSRRLLLR